MNNDICRLLGIEFPLFAFSHCRDVVAAVSRAGGFGVFGGVRCTAEELEQELAWIDRNVDGMPYGADLVFPEKTNAKRGATQEELMELVPQAHKDFIAGILRDHDLEFSRDDQLLRAPTISATVGEELLEVAFRHPIKLIANALGLAPKPMIDMAKAHGVPVAALVGAPKHALRQVEAGVDIIVAQGTEAGGHCGEVSTLVLVPEVLRALKQVGRDVPVLAAGGIVNGRQMAGMMAVGAQGAWTGSVWLATSDSEVSDAFRDKMLKASSRDTVRSTARTGKMCRQLRSTWHDAWSAPGAPEPLGMPLQGVIAIPALNKAEQAADKGNAKAHDMVSYYVGQGVGLIDAIRTTSAVVQDFKEDFADALEAMNSLLE
ncbi:NAD(P)H-dependent flavin oxidoreductase [Antarctobacter sp.]|uniref:NAD(P)H-dependent flavin oxidoreductase n=1 Tax=Antarctobacter sp. TaxID=1872577 RepID=UPI003A8DB239